MLRLRLRLRLRAHYVRRVKREELALLAKHIRPIRLIRPIGKDENDKTENNVVITSPKNVQR